MAHYHAVADAARQAHGKVKLLREVLEKRKMEKPPADMLRVQPGDTLNFRCGGAAIVKRIEQRGEVIVILTLEEMSDATYSFRSNGDYQGVNPHALDVVRVDPRPMTDRERLDIVNHIAKEALRNTVPTNVARDYLLRILEASRP